MRGPMLSRLWFPLGTIIFGLWLFGVLPVDPPRWLTEGPSVDPIIAQPEMARVLFLVMLILISVGPFMWIDTARLRRRFPLMDLPAVCRMVFSSRRGALTFLVLLLFAGQTAWVVLFRGVPVGSYFVRINLAIACGVLMIILLPPTAIVLASSSGESGRLLEAVARSFFPYRVVSLLDGSRLAPTIWANKNDNLRTILGRTWRSTVHRLVDISPITIVDARSATPPVCEEIQYMLHPDRVGRAVFVINDDGSAPGLREVRSDWQRLQLVCAFPSQVAGVIASFRRNGCITQPGQDSVYDWRPDQCAKCHRKMKVLAHREYGLGMLPVNAQMLRLMNEGKVKGAFFCQQCKRVYCFDCSDGDSKCQCGKNSGWGETVYMEG